MKLMSIFEAKARFSFFAIALVAKRFGLIQVDEVKRISQTA